MEITEVRVKLMDEPSERLQAFCSITFDQCFVVRDLKIIEGTNGPFVAMPSRKLTAHCPKCGSKNHLRASFCNQCGAKLNSDQAVRDEDGRAKLYADIAHPINSACREMIQDRVIEEFRKEQEMAAQPGYRSRYDEFDADLDYVDLRETVDEPAPVEETRKPLEQTQIQPAEAQQPRPPHTAPSPAPTERSVKADGDFGAGIF
ncbi:MAG: septation protein SpoVG family protein [Pirellulales bacterium]|nr:septation protein SpoVG family protein [Pirellulales bacterium]